MITIPLVLPRATNDRAIVFTRSGGKIPEMTSLMTLSLRNSIGFSIFYKNQSCEGKNGLVIVLDVKMNLPS